MIKPSARDGFEGALSWPDRCCLTSMDVTGLTLAEQLIHLALIRPGDAIFPLFCRPGGFRNDAFDRQNGPIR